MNENLPGILFHRKSTRRKFMSWNYTLRLIHMPWIDHQKFHFFYFNSSHFVTHLKTFFLRQSFISPFQTKWHLQDSSNLFLLIFYTQSKAEEKVFSFVSFGCCLLHSFFSVFPIWFGVISFILLPFIFCLLMGECFLLEHECVPGREKWILWNIAVWSFTAFLNEISSLCLSLTMTRLEKW